jgi:glycosyltransferase involved in cell wall biosynthesis
VTTARLYGRQLGHGSLAIVTRGFESALKAYGLLRGVYAIDLAASYVDGECPTDGADARHGVYVGPLNAVGQMFERGRHEKHWVMVTPNSDQLPQDLVTKLTRYQNDHVVQYMAPSRWAARVVQGFLGSCITVPHGVSPEYQPHPEYAKELSDQYEQGAFRVIHFSSSDRQRKGTFELLKAWEILVQSKAWDGAQLLCVMDYPARVAIEEAIADGEIQDWSSLKQSVTLMDRADLAPDVMARTLCRSHVVCQPSRGEGFGLVPLEALCSGVPVVATAVTGHSEYMPACYKALEEIPTGPLAPIDDLPGSLAPSVYPPSIAQALKRARDDWRTLWMWAQNGSPTLRAQWQWACSLNDFADQLLKSS